MKRLSVLMSLIILLAFNAFGQRYLTKTGHIYFYSKTPFETIEAHNRQVNCALDVKSGMFVFKVLMRSFIFEKALMQEHFNEDYVESDKFPNATFIGKIDNVKEIAFNKAGTYNAKVSGTLTIHGVSRTVHENGTFIVSDKGIAAQSKFLIKLSEYNIDIPEIVAREIANEFNIFVDVDLKSLKK